jgi:hypothetical protein
MARLAARTQLTGVAHALPRFQMTAHSIGSTRRRAQLGEKLLDSIVANSYTTSPSSFASPYDRINAPAMPDDDIGSSQLRKHAREDDLEDNLPLRGHRKILQLRADVAQEAAIADLESSAADGCNSKSQEKEKEKVVCPGQPSQTQHSETFFVHKPLQLGIPSIRLIELLPSEEDDDIRCIVRHVTLEVPPSYDPLLDAPIAAHYTCLSYVWGPTDQKHQIIVNGKPFLVRMNLWKFLRTVSLLRATEKYNNKRWHRSLWIDAICIDQENSAEKNHQVQQMGRIYSSAAEVIAWLGDDNTLARLMKAETPESITPKEYGIARLPGKATMVRQPEYYEALCNNAYWKRAWIVQEILHARHLFFLAQGVMMHVDEFKKMLLRVPDLNAKEPWDLLDYAAENSFDMVVSANLITNVELFWHKDCINIRDRIYSFMRSVLGINKRGLCFQSVCSVRWAIQLEQNLLEVDACVPLIAMRGSEMLKNTTICHRCGEDISMVRHKASVSVPSTTRYVCLHCNHFGEKLRRPGVHKNSHVGHLCITRGAIAEENRDDWHLFWAPLEGSEWQKLQGYKYVLASKNGNLRKLILSLGLLCELESLISRHHNEVSIRFSNERICQYPAGTSNWEVVDCKKETPL